MDFWFWFWICFGIILTGAVAQILLLLRLALKAKKLMQPAAKLASLGEALAKTAAAKPEIAAQIPALDQPVGEVFARRKSVLKAKRLRKEARERRLVARLKNLSYEESRLK